jgi:acid phosphatase type 7
MEEFERGRKTGLEYSIEQKAVGNQKFQPLPSPTGSSPYHLSLSQILGADRVSAINKSGAMTFHAVGDTGGVADPLPQQAVADAMESAYDAPATPSFLYILGDVIYYYGEAQNYYPQFYQPYAHYPAPIFAIPGNHDGDVAAPGVSSLAAFVTNFCSRSPVTSPDAGDVGRKTMVQPNVYWTLECPFVTMIGLYSNVPEGGQFDQTQIDWLVSELRSASEDSALIVSAHHPSFSLDDVHSGSAYMAQTLDAAFQKAGRIPDLVFSGHVHNYQRFTRVMGQDQRSVPYIVAGGGGYWNLYKVQLQSGGAPVDLPYKVPGQELSLETYCDTRHGYLLMSATAETLSGEYYAVPVPAEGDPVVAQRFDGFSIDLKKHIVSTD